MPRFEHRRRGERPVVRDARARRDAGEPQRVAGAKGGVEEPHGVRRGIAIVEIEADARALAKRHALAAQRTHITGAFEVVEAHERDALEVLIGQRAHEQQDGSVGLDGVHPANTRHVCGARRRRAAGAPPPVAGHAADQHDDDDGVRENAGAIGHERASSNAARRRTNVLSTSAVASRPMNIVRAPVTDALVHA